MRVAVLTSGPDKRGQFTFFLLWPGNGWNAPRGEAFGQCYFGRPDDYEPDTVLDGRVDNEDARLDEARRLIRKET